MNVRSFLIDDIPAVLYGARSGAVWLFVHGKNGCKEEAAAFAETVCPKGAQVLAIDLPEHGARSGAKARFTPWDAVPELQTLLAWARQRWQHINLRCTSLGAWFALLAFAQSPPDKALFVSPVVDMERLIRRMMGWADVSEERLRCEGEIPTDFGETLSFRYLEYAVSHPIRQWNAPTDILYAERDALVEPDTVTAFCTRFGSTLTVMENAEHWLHTPDELAALRQWEERRA